ncbi:MAG: hypothetical protein KDA29_06325 [Phycisphaerales bacterium]|jgi:hypothetical protein|nr:hypothetical protein [Phycisphaerae bacterium]MBO6740510.1 hypothetical protein [Phycisphaerales bacterium]MCA9275623.1 hypothetical protein [Phycisphaerales bacterium]
MNDLFKILAAASTTVALSISLPGCGESSESKSAETHTADDGHDHAGDGDDHEGHDHAEGEHDDHDHGEMRSLGSVTIAGTKLAVSVSSDIRPSSEVHLDLEVESGPIPATVRFWIGDEAGTGALKSKADAHDDHFHGQTESPSTMDGASLWIEIESVNGNRTVGSMPLEG